MTDPLDLGLELECKYCDYKETITVPEADYISWHNGEFIQDAFPYLTAGQRELMLSNTCDDCWNRFFPDEDQRCTSYFYYCFSYNDPVSVPHIYAVFWDSFVYSGLFFQKE